MKTITTLAAIGVLIAGVSIAAAQNAGGPTPADSSPSNINKGSTGGKLTGKSGNEAGGTAMKRGKSTTGAGMQSPGNTKSPASTDTGTKDKKDR